MKKILTLILFLSLLTEAMAIPAKKGIWKTLPHNGTEIKAQLVGDEHMHFWLTDDGQQLSEQNGMFVAADMKLLRARAEKRRADAAKHRYHNTLRKGIGDFMSYSGKKRGLIILVEFSNMEFLPQNDSLLYTRICNEENFRQGRFRGSVYDYFKAQSYGKFELTFDVVGPVQMDSTYQYYGHDVGEEGNDAHPGQMAAMACQAIDHLVDFNDYDWDGDGFVDQVMCIYAGGGQASSSDAQTIWPHEWDLESSDWGSPLELDGVKINTYACANERDGNGIQGIGTICHEFSHCLGLPDMYDIEYGGNYGMGEWSLMDSGSYNGDGFTPAGYSSFDKYTCGWVKPVELTSNKVIQNMQPLSEKPEVYMVRNQAYADEYFLIENRQKKGWDADLPASGMLILHVDFDREIWLYNLVNTNYPGGGGYPKNDHQRCTMFRPGRPTSNTWSRGSDDVYPCQGNDSLTNTSDPAAKLYHENSSGEKLMDVGIMDIASNGDGTMSFRFRNSVEEIYVPAGTIFYESFSDCVGTGANDGLWSVNMASSTLVTDNEGWETQKPYGGFRCARFGNGSTAGRAVTPTIELETGMAYLSFKAAGWNKDGTTLTIAVEGDGTVEPATVDMVNFAWTDYKVNLKGQGPMRIIFEPEKRFLLDEVLVVSMKNDIDPDTIGTDTIVDPDTVITAIAHHRQQHPTLRRAGCYTLDGRYAGANPSLLPRGMYIIYNSEERKGRKFVK